MKHAWMIGEKFGRLTVESVRSDRKATMLMCRCECGNAKAVTYSNIRSGNTKSCGCWKSEYGRARGSANSTHGRSGTRAYRTWQSMRRRCSDSRHRDFQWYGARGITVCDRWLFSFENFYADMGDPPDGMSIDRKDNDGNYEPLNCRWATATEQNRNRRNCRTHAKLIEAGRLVLT